MRFMSAQGHGETGTIRYQPTAPESAPLPETARGVPHTPPSQPRDPQRSAEKPLGLVEGLGIDLTDPAAGSAQEVAQALGPDVAVGVLDEPEVAHQVGQQAPVFPENRHPVQPDLSGSPWLSIPVQRGVRVGSTPGHA